MTPTETRLLRVLEEVLPFATFFPRHRRVLNAASAAEDPVASDAYAKEELEELEKSLEDDRTRANGLDEKSFKLSLSLSVALTILGTLSPLLFDRFTSQGLLDVGATLMAASVFYALMGGFIGLGAMKALASYGLRPLGLPKTAVTARRGLLAASLARNQKVSIARQLRNAAAYQNLRNSLVCLAAVLGVYAYGLASGGATLKPPRGPGLVPVVAASPATSAARGSDDYRFRPVGQTSALAQTVSWSTNDVIAVGRWDATITVFRRSKNGGGDLVLEAVMAAPSHRGIEMVARLDDDILLSSDGDGGLALWRRAPDRSFQLAGQPKYDPAYGTANSATILFIKGETFVATGFSDGHVALWRWSGAALTFLKAFDVRSPGAAANPWGLHNIRGVQVWRGSILVTGSEDGDIVGLDMPAGREVFRTRYNSTAQRGINSISVSGDMLLLANCAVGSADHNAWLFDLSSGHPVLLDAKRFVEDAGRSQVFDFDAILVKGALGGVDFFAATEEGLLWEGRVDRSRLIVDGYAKTAAEGAAAIASSLDGDMVVSASGSIELFKPE